MKRTIASLTLLVLAGCTSARPPVWLLYADAKQAYGRMQVQFEILCDVITPENQRICTEASVVDQNIQLLEPGIRAELSKERPDWDKIMQFVQLAIGIASKFAAVPRLHQGILVPKLPQPLPRLPLLPLTPQTTPQGGAGTHIPACRSYPATLECGLLDVKLESAAPGGIPWEESRSFHVLVVRDR